MVGAIGAGTPLPAARPIPVPGAALAPTNLDLDWKREDEPIFNVGSSQLLVLLMLARKAWKFRSEQGYNPDLCNARAVIASFLVSNTNA